MNQQQRLSYLARNFNMLHFGLWVMIPLGLGNLMAGLARCLGLVEAGGFSLLVLPGVVTIVLSLCAIGYSSSRRGLVQPARSGRKLLEAVVAVVVFIAIIRLIPLGLQNRVNFDDMTAALMLILAGALPSFPWRHYTWVGCGLLAAALMPWAGWASMAWFYRGWDAVLMGLAFLLCGVLDEFRLMRLLRPAEAA